MFFKKFENDDRGFVQREYDIRDDEIKPSNSKKICIVRNARQFSDMA